jgi:hypothetical protein
MSAEAETDPRGLSAIVDGDPAAGAPGAAGSPAEDARLQTEPPMITKPRPITVWMTEPAP